MSHSELDAKSLRASLDHPVIDSDGHWIEYGPHMIKALKRHGGDAAVEGFMQFGNRISDVLAMGLERRSETRQAQEAWWALPTRNTRDRATVMLPKLLCERLDEFGIDFGVIYPTAGLGLPQVPDATCRRAACGAYNSYIAEYFGDHTDRMTPAAVIPMYDPDEAIAELEHVKELGLKSIMMGSLIKRPIPALAVRDSEMADEFPWLDVIGIDSPYDYDPVWQCCLELSFSPTFHSNGRGRAFGLRNSVSNFVYNHIGHFAAASEAVCKSLIMGGVTKRFPTLQFGFLEGGVGWACQLYADLLGHWEKRKLDALADIDPDNLDQEGLLAYARDYASEDFLEVMEARAARKAVVANAVSPVDGLDDFAACGFETEEKLIGQFVDQFYFGCEADDPINAWAFARNHLPHGVQLNTLFGSDIGHFDVRDMAGVLTEAHELVDDGLIDRNNFRDFVFENAVRFLSRNNRNFFAGTAVEKPVSDYWEDAERL